MSATDPKQQPQALSRKQRQKEHKPLPAQSGAERLKTVVRRLPPNLPEEIFWQSVQAWVTDDSVTWKSFCPGKWRTKRPNKEGVPSRAYIAFKSEEQVATFSREYDGHVFRDKAGIESQAVVEFAPFQKVPTEKKKVDARNNTIDKDEDYISFLETLKAAGQKTEGLSLETLIAASQPPPAPTTTPLLEALKAEKSAQKDREAILRNHAHYKDAAASGGGAAFKKEETRKKAAAVAAAAHAAKHPDPPASLSKKAKKAAAAAAQAAATATQRATSTQLQTQSQIAAQEGGPPHSGKSGAHAHPAPPSSAKLPPASVPRHRPFNKDVVHARPHPAAKGDPTAPTHQSLSVPASSPGGGTVPALTPIKSGLPTPNTSSLTTDNLSQGTLAPGGSAQGPARKSRPTVGLGRQFEAALSGAVATGSVVDRKKRDKSGSGSGGGGGDVAPGSLDGTNKFGAKHREEHGRAAAVPAAAVVPNILQRPEMGASGQTEGVMIMQRPPTPRGMESVGSGGYGEGAGAGAGAGTSRGGGRRGRGRGRGGHRGG